jgi:DNA-binding transcriptional ArsR family regulator
LVVCNDHIIYLIVNCGSLAKQDHLIAEICPAGRVVKVYSIQYTVYCMKTNKELILELIEQFGEVTVNELINNIGVGRQMIHRHLKSLLIEGKIIKRGTPPKVFYITIPKAGGNFVFDTALAPRSVNLPPVSEKFIQENFLFRTPDGRLIEGVSGFLAWSTKINTSNLTSLTERYMNELEKAAKLKFRGVIDATKKLLNTDIFEDDLFLDKLCYLELYNMGEFGKTKLSQLIAVAKEDESREAALRVAQEVKIRIKNFIYENGIDSVAYIPPSIKRAHQLMTILKEEVNINVSDIRLHKIVNEFVRPQKSLETTQDRIINARNTIFVEGTGEFNRILLIDDVTGSGATLNEVARKIKPKYLKQGGEIWGLTLVGSMKGFDVIRTV